MPQIPPGMVGTATTEVLKWIAVQIRSLPPTDRRAAKAVVPPVASASHREDGCPACSMHRHLAEADRLMAGMAIQARQEGKVSRPAASTLLLVAQQLRQTDMVLDEIAMNRPDLMLAVADLKVKVAGCAAIVPQPSQADPETVVELAKQVHACWYQGWRISVAYFTSPSAEPEPDAVRLWYEKAVREQQDPDTALTELKKVLNG